MTTLTAGNGANPGSESPAVVPGVLNTATGDQPPANVGLTLEAIEKLLDAKIAPVVHRVDRLSNSTAASARIARRGGSENVLQDQGQSPTAPNIDAIPDEATRAWARQVQRENEARSAREAEAEAEAARNKARYALEDLIAKHMPARPDRLKREMLPYLKVGTDGQVYHDDGSTLRPVVDVFRENLTDDVYKPTSVTNGTGTLSGSAPIIGSHDSYRIEMAATAAIADPVARASRQMEIRAKHNK